MINVHGILFYFNIVIIRATDFSVVGSKCIERSWFIWSIPRHEDLVVLSVARTFFKETLPAQNIPFSAFLEHAILAYLVMYSRKNRDNRTDKKKNRPTFLFFIFRLRLHDFIISEARPCYQQLELNTIRFLLHNIFEYIKFFNSLTSLWFKIEITSKSHERVNNIKMVKKT